MIFTIIYIYYNIKFTMLNVDQFTHIRSDQLPNSYEFTKKILLADNRLKVPIYTPKFKHNIVKVLDCYDGDTIHCSGLLEVPDIPFKFSVRLNGIDTPEMKSKSQVEKDHAKIAKKALSDMIPAGTLVNFNLRDTDGPIEYDKYGRILAYIYTKKDGKDINLSEWMLENKYAVKYDGGTKHEWVFN